MDENKGFQKEFRFNGRSYLMYVKDYQDLDQADLDIYKIEGRAVFSSFI